METYLIQIAEEDAAVAAGMAEADRGEVVDAAVVSAENEAALHARGVTSEQLAAIGEEVRREFEGALRRFLDTENSQLADIEAGLREADAGDFATVEEMQALWSRFEGQGQR